MFFVIFFSVYTAVNLVIGINLAVGLSPLGAWRWPLLIVFVVLAASYPAGRIIGGDSPSVLSHWLEVAGSWYLAFMVPMLFLYLAADIAWLALPKKWLAAVGIGWGGVTVVVMAVTALVTVYGHVNSRIIRVQELAVNVAKSVPGRDELTVAFASDIHVGAVITLDRLDAIVDKLNGLEADVIFLGGDIIDGRTDGLAESSVCRGLCDLSAPLGVFSVHGNHEHYRGADKMQRILEESNVTVLRDAVAEIVPGVWLIGRDDYALTQRFDTERAALSELIENIPADAVRLMMDHQPRDLSPAEEYGIDLQLSGHTHNGQMTPFQLVTAKVFEVSWGYARRADTHYYVSSGAGTWGPPVRTGNVPEVVKLTIRFTPPR